MYSLDTTLGNVLLSLSGTRTNSLKIKVAPDQAQATDIAGTMNGPDKLTWRAGLTLTRAGLTASAFVNHRDDYINDNPFSSIAPQRIGSYTDADVRLSFGIERLGAEVSVGAQNVFARKPNFVDVPLGVDMTRTDFRERTLYVDMTRRFGL